MKPVLNRFLAIPDTRLQKLEPRPRKPAGRAAPPGLPFERDLSSTTCSSFLTRVMSFAAKTSLAQLVTLAARTLIVSLPLRSIPCAGCYALSLGSWFC
jgi:hypothetical protein